MFDFSHASSIDGKSVHLFSQYKNVSAAIGWIGMKFCKDIQGQILRLFLSFHHEFTICEFLWNVSTTLIILLVTGGHYDRFTEHIIRWF